jgi:hypothetical protein
MKNMIIKNIHRKSLSSVATCSLLAAAIMTFAAA